MEIISAGLQLGMLYYSSVCCCHIRNKTMRRKI
ncbi:hypothetical protein OIU74_012086 [Salix koriyanagi]|uniref:Uncharacterized protein n=1 Tax=Salix koriyanagi TaxID=2511006 RepID=A0A9Q0T4G6_9ROSI|nr:hypothetical protein OIU74_012086 [Salix koriyanagi]